MFCSTIIPTIGRSTLTRAVESVLAQNLAEADFEVIVVNDSGRPLPAADWQCSERVRIIATNRHNRSVARNTGAAIAHGRYLHFLDDDDWLLPGALAKFWELTQSSCAAWVYGGFCLVNNEGDLIQKIVPDEANNCYVQLMASEWIPLQASLIQSQAFFAVGGFAPLPSLLGGYEDIDLSRQIVHRYEMAGLTAVVASIRIGDNSSTTNYINMFDQNRQSREKALNMPSAFTRLCHSAQAAAPQASYWYGRIIYYYLASLRWNLQCQRFFTAMSRGIYLLAGFIRAGRHAFTAAFWRALTKPHINKVRTAVEAFSNTLYAQTIWKS